MGTPQDIVITGIGLVCCLGDSPDKTFARILESACGLGSMNALEQPPAPDRGGGQAVDLPEHYSPTLPRAARYLRWAVEESLRGTGASTLPPSRISACIGTTLHGMRAGGEFLRSKDPLRLREFLAGSVLHGAMAGLRIGGSRVTCCSACSSGLGSIGLACAQLRSCEADLVLAGGYDSVSEYAYAGFDSLRLIAEGMPLPFAGARDGMKVAEGYGVVALERRASVEQRQGRILAHVAGIGESSDAFHLTQPQPDGAGAAKALRSALAHAGLNASEIDLITAHATATPNNDAAEYAGLSTVFGDKLREIPTTAFKGHIGHTLGGAGTVELILSILARVSGLVPPVAHRARVDPQFVDLRLVQDRPETRQVRNSVNLSLGFGGSNACVLLSDQPTKRHAFGQTTHHEVAITGVGVVVPGAIGNREFVDLVRKGPPIDTALWREISPEDRLDALINARRARRISGYSKLTLASTVLACEDASVRDNSAFLERCCVLLGTTHGSSPYCEQYYSEIVRGGMGAANPVLFAEGVPNAAAAHVSLLLGIRGACQTIIGTRTAGLDALRLAAQRIRSGEWDRALVSAGEERSTVVESAYRACMSHDGEETEVVVGSGSVTFVLESRHLAESRGARPRAVIDTSAARSEPDAHAPTALVIDQIGRPAQVISALGGSRPDRVAARQMSGDGSHAHQHWTISGLIPELFSAGPLAALAALLLTPEQVLTPPEALRNGVGVLATEYAGGATAVRIRTLPG